MCLSGCLDGSVIAIEQGSGRGGFMYRKQAGSKRWIMMKVDLVEWKSKAEAAAILECSEKTIERMVGRKEIERQDRRIPGRKSLPVYNPKDIERLREKSAVVEAFPVKGQGNGNALVKQKRGVGDLAALIDLFGDRERPRVAVNEKLYLSLDEAVELSGLSRAFLLRQIKGGELKAIKDRGWKIRRSELLKL